MKTKNKKGETPFIALEDIEGEDGICKTVQIGFASEHPELKKECEK